MDLRFESIKHFRELGGYKTIDGKTIRNGLIYRSGELCSVNAEELKKLNDLKIDTVFDLRSHKEQTARKDVEGNYKIVCCPLAAEERKGSEKYQNPTSYLDRIVNANEAYYNYTVYNFAKGYLDFAYNTETISLIIDAMNKHQTFLFHCFGGKDRTGVISMLIMALLGCDYETCKKDYMYHNEITKEEFALYQKYIKNFKPSIWGEKISELTFKTWDFLFDSAWYSIFDVYGSIEGYLADQFNISVDQINDWRDYYLK